MCLGCSLDPLILTLSFYPSVHNQLIRTLFDTHIVQFHPSCLMLATISSAMSFLAKGKNVRAYIDPTALVKLPDMESKQVILITLDVLGR